MYCSGLFIFVAVIMSLYQAGRGLLWYVHTWNPDTWKGWEKIYFVRIHAALLYFILHSALMGCRFSVYLKAETGISRRPRS